MATRRAGVGSDGASAAAAALLAAATLAVFARTIGHPFLNFDDTLYVTANPDVTAGLSLRGLRWAFTTTVASNWHPLTLLSHQVDVSLFGLKPWGHHLTNVLLHTANAVLLLFLLRSLTGALWRSLLAAALFAVHPLRVESVAWVSERKDLLAGLCWILSCAAYLGWIRRGGTRRYVLLAAIFGAGLMAKPMVVTLPAALLLLDWWPLGRLARPVDRTGTSLLRMILEKVPLFALAAASSALTIYVQERGGSLFPLDDLPLATRAANAVLSYLRYLREMLWPAGLAPFYPLDSPMLPYRTVVLALVALSALTLAAVLPNRRAPWLAVGWAWYIGTLLPVIGLVQVGSQAMADRYTYLPLIGLAVALAWSAGAVAARSRVTRGGLAAALTLVLCTLSLASFRQAGFWRDSETLTRRTLAVTEGNFFAHMNLGAALLRQGRGGEAIEHFAAAVRLRPEWGKARKVFGELLLRRGELEEALRQLQAARELLPQDPLVHDLFGQALLALGRPREAASCFTTALSLEPAFHGARVHLQRAEALSDRPRGGPEHGSGSLR